MGRNLKEQHGNLIDEFTHNGELFQTRVSSKEDKEEVNKLANDFGSPVSTFTYLWESWDNWDSYPPLVLEKNDEKIVGFRAATYLNSGYINSYYVLLHEDYRGKGLGKKLFSSALKKANEIECYRWTNKTSTDDSYGFYNGALNLKPVGKQGDEFIFDFSIRDLTSFEELKESSQKKDLRIEPPMPVKRLKKYLKKADEIYLPDEVVDRHRDPEKTVLEHLEEGEI